MHGCIPQPIMTELCSLLDLKPLLFPKQCWHIVRVSLAGTQARDCTCVLPYQRNIINGYNVIKIGVWFSVSSFMWQLFNRPSEFRAVHRMGARGPRDSDIRPLTPCLKHHGRCRHEFVDGFVQCWKLLAQERPNSQVS